MNEPKPAAQDAPNARRKRDYQLIDLYEGTPDLIGVYATLDSATAAARIYDADTDGECSLILAETRTVTRVLQDWRY